MTNRRGAKVKNFALALFFSLVVHALLALALVVCLTCSSQPDVLATLDLSSVELSFSEQEQETAAVTPMPEARRPEVRPSVAESPPDVRSEGPRSRPPDPMTPKLPEPKPRASVFSPPSPAVERPAPRQARLDAPPKPRRAIRPDYPRGARQRGEEGAVTLEIRVNEEGAVDDVRTVVSSGFAELDEAAVKAVRAAKFTPARAGRDPVASTARLTLQFRLK